MTWVTLNMKSANRKVGPIPVSTSDTDTCPDECSLKDGDCYARFGPLGLHWRKIGPDGRGDNWDKFCDRISKLISGALWRHNQAGDLPKNSKGKIHLTKLRKLYKAAKHTLGFTYTHYDPTDIHNANAVKESNDAGFVINLSADSLTQADEYANMDIGPVITLVPLGTDPLGIRTPEGRVVSMCPAQTQDDVSCDMCKLCSKGKRKAVVGFYPHGTAGKRLNNILEEA